MIVIAGKFATFGELWFDEDPAQAAGVDVLMYRQRRSPVDGGRSVKSLSLTNDLTLAEDQIMSALGRTNRYEIRRAENQDGLRLDFFIDPSAQLDGFSAFYDDFARQKRLPPAYRRGLRAASGAGQLVLSCASSNTQSLVWHAYVCHREQVALLHSVSHFRDMQNGDRALLARANRWLHWRDMLRFKEMGLRCYDWGGLFEDETDPRRAGINKFKREFGGRVVHTFSCNVPITMKGRAYLALRGALDRLDAR